MKISVIVPAFNEAKLIAATLRSIRAASAAFASLGWDRELIVCDNNSTDGTADLARAEGATVVFEPVNQIARARNRGGGGTDSKRGLRRRWLDDQIGRAAFLAQPLHRWLESRQSFDEMGRRLACVLRSSGVPRSGRLQPRAVRGRGTGPEPAPEEAGPPARLALRHSAPGAAGHFGAQSPALHLRRTAACFSARGVYPEALHAGPFSMRHVVRRPAVSLQGVWKAARSGDRAYRTADCGAFPVGRVPSRGALAAFPNTRFVV